MKNGEQELERRHERVRDYEDRRERSQTEVNRLHREHVDRRAEHDAAQARRADAERRLSQLETGLADVRAELDRTETDLRAARGRMETAIDALAALEPQRIELESERERLRAEQTTARATAQATRQRARELALQVESRRTSHAALETTLARLDKQLEDLVQRRDELLRKLAAGEAPLAALAGELERALGRARRSRASCMQPASQARSSMRCCASARARRRPLDERVEAARAALDDARLAAQQVRVRRESIAEQLAATRSSWPRCSPVSRPRRPRRPGRADLQETKGKIERLGQVNLAAIGEFKEQSERKEYLDRQCKDLTDALETLEIGHAQDRSRDAQRASRIPSTRSTPG